MVGFGMDPPHYGRMPIPQIMQLPQAANGRFRPYAGQQAARGLGIKHQGITFVFAGVFHETSFDLFLALL